MSAVLVSPDGTIYATQSGTIMSFDHGETWHPSLNQSFSARKFVFDPRAPATVYAAAPRPTGSSFAGGLFKSTDHGEHFSRLGSEEIGPDAVDVALDPILSSTVYVVSRDRLLRSIDGGLSWTDRTTGLPSSPLSIAVNPAQPSVVYAGTRGGWVSRSVDGGQTWDPFTSGLGYAAVYALAVDPNRYLYAGTDGDGVSATRTGDLASVCASGPGTLCLSDGRFSVAVVFRPPDGSPGEAHAVPIALNTGAFWFFSPDNLELVVKVLDGRSINGKFWVFYGALSNVAYTITVTDMQTGAVRTYFNSQGQLASVADTSAF